MKILQFSNVCKENLSILKCSLSKASHNMGCSA